MPESFMALGLSPLPKHRTTSSIILALRLRVCIYILKHPTDVICGTQCLFFLMESLTSTVYVLVRLKLKTTYSHHYGFSATSSLQSATERSHVLLRSQDKVLQELIERHSYEQQEKY